ncbi:MAG: hypothetical protein OXC91_00365 [Rhodobacteraceae bacterium]|nr:hypothetical protein [Paracoccaceae bacterium]
MWIRNSGVVLSIRRRTGPWPPRRSTGLVVWDGRSPGSLNNVFEMLRHGKMVAVYVAPRRGFLDVKELADTDVLLQAYAQYPAQDPSSLPLFAKVARDSSTSNKPAGTKSGIDEDDTQTIQNSR